MRTFINKILLTATLVLLVRVGNSQSFLNLDFESANLTGYPPTSAVPATNAFPGWTANAQYILYDNISLSGKSISIFDTNVAPYATSIQGSYYARFIADNSPSGTQTISLGQTGTIPLGTYSITFWGNIGGLQITFAGQSLGFTEIGTTANYNIYAADVSAFAGQTGQLLFSQPAHVLAAALDNVQFSPSQVPEPSTFALSALGALLFLTRLSRRRG